MIVPAVRVHTKRFVIVATSALLFTFVGACGSPQVSRESASEHFRSAMSIRADMSRQYIYGGIDDVSDLLPTSSVELGPGVTGPVSEFAVVGSIETVKKGYSYTLDPEEGPGMIRADFDAPGAATRTISFVLKPDSVLGTDGVATKPASFEVGLAMPGNFDFELGSKGLSQLGRVLVLLKKTSAFPDQPELWGVVFDGEAIGVIGPTNEVDFRYSPHIAALTSDGSGKASLSVLTG